MPFSRKRGARKDNPKIDEAGSEHAKPDAIQAIIHAPKWPLVLGSILVLSGLLVLFVGAEAMPLWRKLLGALISELGFAFFIAFVLHATLEYHAREESEKQVSRGILSYIYRADLDNKLFFATEEHIFRAKFYRRSLDVEYEFLAKKDDRFLVKHTLTYIIENISQSTETYEIKTYVEKADYVAPNERVDPTILTGLQRLTIDGKPLTPEQIKAADDRLIDDDDFERCSHPITLNPGEKRRIQAVHIVEKYAQDSELWRSLLPCSDLTFRVRWNKDFNIKVRAQAVHPFDAFDSLDIDENSLNANLAKPFFPQNGVYFWWGPKGNELLTPALEQPNSDGKLS